MNDNPAIPRLATILGYAGLAPFIGATAAMFTEDRVLSPVGLYVLSVYATVILSFMGAVHWGMAMARGHAQDRLQLALSVWPALLAWLTLVTLPPREALVTFGVLFALLLGADLLAIRQGLAPAWYARLRVPLTVIVCATLWLAAWQVGR